MVDNLGSHFTSKMCAWLSDNPNITFQCTSIGASCINPIEIWFGLIARQAIRRRTLGSAKQLITIIKNYIDTWNSTCQSFAWTADAQAILAKVRWIESEVRKLQELERGP